MAPTPLEKPDLEEGCFGITFERKYYKANDNFIKRSLRPSEFMTGYCGLHIPRAGKERLMNEAASPTFPFRRCIALSKTPAPTTLSPTTRKRRRSPLRSLTSKSLGGPSGIVIPPYRVTLKSKNDRWTLSDSEVGECVFCHNDLSLYNIIVDPDTLKINAIIDWEYAGFYPAYFEFPFYTRLGPSTAIKEEINDTSLLLEFLTSRTVRLH